MVFFLAMLTAVTAYATDNVNHIRCGLVRGSTGWVALYESILYRNPGDVSSVQTGVLLPLGPTWVDRVDDSNHYAFCSRLTGRIDDGVKMETFLFKFKDKFSAENISDSCDIIGSGVVLSAQADRVLQRGESVELSAKDAGDEDSKFVEYFPPAFPDVQRGMDHYQRLRLCQDKFGGTNL